MAREKILRNVFLKPCLLTTLRIKDCYQIQIIHVLQMQIWQINEKWPRLEPCFLTLGSFDGLHKGHQELLKQLKAEAQAQGLKTVALSFSPHPRQILSPEVELQTIAPLDWLTEEWSRLSIDHLIIKKIDAQFLKISATEFLKTLLSEISVQGFVVGHDVGFGQGREGNSEFLREYCGQNQLFFQQVNALKEDGELISSRAIRELIKNKNLEKLEKFLNRKYFVQGKVVGGAKLGRQLGFPTANLQLPESLCLPLGVYAGQCLTGKEWHWAVANIGYRPSVDHEKRLHFEVHILDFQGDIYGQDLRFEFDHQLRDEKKFSGLDELKAQIHKDVENLRRWSSYKKRHSNII